MLFFINYHTLISILFKITIDKKGIYCYHFYMKNQQMNVKHLKFDSKEKLNYFLKELLKLIDKQREFNIFAHEIGDYHYSTDLYRGQELIDYKYRNIVKHGFEVDNYGGIGGTAKLIGSSKMDIADELVDYSYYGGIENKKILVMAIPKYIEGFLSKIEYSSYNAPSLKENRRRFREVAGNLKTEYGKKHIMLSGHHLKRSLFDALKGYKGLPNYYALGFICSNEKTNEYEFIYNQDHLSHLSKQENKEYDSLMRQKLDEAYEKYGTRKPEELIVQAYEKECGEWWNEKDSDID